MLNVNALSYSGWILGIKEEGAGLMVLIEQNVKNCFPTVLAGFIVPAIKEAFIAKKYKAGDEIAILGGQFYQKNDIPRIRVSSMEQLMKMPEGVPQFNSFEVTGVVQSIEDIEGGRILYVYQLVGGLMPTVYDVFVPSRSLGLFENISKNDEVFVKGTVYTKDGMVRIRAAEADDLQKLQTEFFLGDEEARDKFI